MCLGGHPSSELRDPEWNKGVVGPGVADPELSQDCYLWVPKAEDTAYLAPGSSMGSGINEMRPTTSRANSFPISLVRSLLPHDNQQAECEENHSWARINVCVHLVLHPLTLSYQQDSGF